jgi:two-component system phosphate regulon sensor histidine kinase PhoR
VVGRATLNIRATVFSPTRSLLAALLSTTVVVTVALGWAGWRLLEQQQALDDQRARDRSESMADAVAARIRGRLAEAGERLSGWVSSPSSPVPAIDGSVVAGLRADGIHVNPIGGLPFVPVAIRAPSTADPFAALEASEFDDDLERAGAGYRRLTHHRDPHVRAGALLRLGRVQRKTRDLSGALVTYQQLAELGAVPIEELPAELAGLNGLQATHRAMADHEQANAIGRRILGGLDRGRWLIARGAADLYRDPFREPRPESWRLAVALSDLWRDTDGQLPARGQRTLNTPETADSSVLVLWRSNGTSTAAMAADADRFFEPPATMSTAWQLVDPEGRRISGRAAAPPDALARIIGNSEYPWTLYTWMEAPDGTDTRSRATLLAMMGAMLAFVWGASYFMARAIRREAAVARLQSDFVAAVSHEFRSPLTTVRQMAEMLDDDRVLTDGRRHQYYRILAAEAARLQRLVETLLNFGRMEAGAERYRFVDLDAAALVREVVDDIEPHARASGKAIEIDGPDVAIRVHADQSALAMALRNLIDNAIKYSPGEPTVWVRCRKERDGAAICVIDRGVGISRSEQRAIFGKFVRGRAAVEANIKGTGVGLSMVQQIVTAHGGTIRLESEPGGGSTFTLLLPLAS